MGLSSYTDLKTALSSHLDRSDLTSYLDDFIDIAESMHQRDIRIREMIVRDNITIDSRQETVPSAVLEVISLRLLTTPVTVLEYVNMHEMNRLRQEVTGKPTRYTIHEEFEFDVTPAETYTGEIIYYGSVTALSGSTSSNAILSKAPDLYLYAALMAAAPFLGADERIQTWGTLYKSGVEALNARARQARVVGPLVSRVAGATP
jgi:hypothetical protein